MSAHNSSAKSLFLLHFIVIIFGFTGILGKLISIESAQLVWYRMFFGTIVLVIYLSARKKSLILKKEGRIQTLFTGIIIAAHWITFFEAIKLSNVSITLAALASASMFTAFLEPLFFRRRLSGQEIFLAAMVIAGLYFIFQFETENSIGFFVGLISAFLASLFTVINGKLIQKYDANRISLYELGGGAIAISLYLLFSGKEFPDFQLSYSNWLWILILAILATAFAFVVSVEVMKELTPFTVSLSINLEPVYGIILAFLIFGEEEKMSFGFYIGTLTILAAIFINEGLKRRKRIREMTYSTEQ